MAVERVGIYPGTFDPVTNGHMDIIARATRVVDRLIVAVAVNADKNTLFTLDERVDMGEADIKALDPATAARIAVRPVDNL